MVMGIENGWGKVEPKEWLSAQLNYLRGVITNISSGADLNRALYEIMRAVAQACGTNMNTVYLADKQDIYLVASMGLPEEFVRAVSRVPIGGPLGGCCGTAVARGQTVIIEDMRSDPLWEPYLELSERFGLRAVWSVPIIGREGRAMGTFAAYSREPYRPSIEQINLMEIYAGYAAAIIDAARFYREIERRLHELEGLYEIARSFGAMRDPETLYGQLTQKMANLIGAAKCVIAIYDPQSRQLCPQPPGYGMSDQDLAELLRQMATATLDAELHWDLRRRGPYIANDMSQIPEALRWFVDVLGVRNLLAVAMLRGDEPIGVIYAADKLGGFTEEDAHLMGVFASQAAAVIQNAWLYERLAASEAKYRSIFEGAPIGIYQSTPEGRIIAANPALARLLGCECAEDLVGASAVEFYADPAERERWRQELERAGVLQSECQLKSRDGRPIWARDIARAVRDQNGQILYYEGMLLDITEQRVVELKLARIYEVMMRYRGQELFEQAARALAELLDTRYAIIGELDKKCQSVRALAFYKCGALERDLQYDLEGTPCQDVLKDASPYAYPGGAYRLFPRDQFLVALGIESYIGAPLVDGAGNIIGIVNAFDERPKHFNDSDLHLLQIVGQRVGIEIERGHSEEAYRKLQEQLFQAQKMEVVGTLAGGIAHDFNNLLTGIIGFAEMAAMKIGHAHEANQYLKQVLQLGARARDLIERLLLFSRPKTGERQLCNLGEFLKDVVRLLERTIPEDIQVELVADPDIYVEVNLSQLEQVMINLAVNARDAMPEGGRLLIEAVALPTNFARITVSDTGCGIPQDVLAHIFEPFFTTKGVGKGTGLGLSVAYGIVKAHGGWIEVESQVGRGSSFHIYLPGARGAATETAQIAVGQEEVQMGRGETVLIVEDEPAVLELGRQILQSLGYRAMVARDGLEGISIYAEHKDQIDLVLLDIVMPRMGGQKVFEELRGINPGVKVLLVTGYSPEEIADELLKRGAAGLIQKPYDLKALARAIRNALDS